MYPRLTLEAEDREALGRGFLTPGHAAGGVRWVPPRSHQGRLTVVEAPPVSPGQPCGGTPFRHLRRPAGGNYLLALEVGRHQDLDPGVGTD